MPTYYVNLWTAIRAKIASVWTDVPANGIYHTLELNRVPWDQKADDNLPLAAFETMLRPSGEWGSANAVEEGSITIWRIVHDSVLADTLIASLEALRTEFYDNNPTVGQIIAYPRIEFHTMLSLNQYFLGTLKPFFCGCVVLPIVVGETQL